MKLFVDTANIAEIRDLHDLGILDGVTTNPSLMATTQRDTDAVIRDICAIVQGAVSAEVIATDTATMIREGERLAALANNVAVKVPLTWDGIRACKHLSSNGIMVNVTLCFSIAQALVAAKAGAAFISPFIGRLDDMNSDGLQLIEDIRTLYDTHQFSTEILAASVRNINHVTDAALVGADIATIPPQTMRALVNHPLTKQGLDKFLSDWQGRKTS